MTPHQEFLAQRREIEGALLRFDQRYHRTAQSIETYRDNIKAMTVEIVAAIGHLVEAFGGDESSFAHDMSGTDDAIDDAFADAIKARDAAKEAMHELKKGYRDEL